jgi:hypothetical protein
MSRLVADHTALDDDSATQFSRGHFDFPKGQHEAFPEVIGTSGPSALPMPGPEDDEMAEIEITAGQKMLSAMSGSLLTSLLGMWHIAIQTLSGN